MSGDGAPAGGAPPEGAPATPPAQTQPPAAPPAPAAQTPPAASVDEPDDGLLDVKEGDAAWVKRLRVTAAGYRSERNDLRTQLAARDAEIAQYKARDAAAEAAQRGAALRTVAEKHGLWDATADGGKGGLVPGISLGDDPAKYEEIAGALTQRLRPARGIGAGVAAHRPATVAASTTSGTSDAPPSGTGRAASALRALMQERGSTAG